MMADPGSWITLLRGLVGMALLLVTICLVPFIFVLLAIGWTRTLGWNKTSYIRGYGAVKRLLIVVGLLSLMAETLLFMIARLWPDSRLWSPFVSMFVLALYPGWSLIGLLGFASLACQTSASLNMPRILNTLGVLALIVYTGTLCSSYAFSSISIIKDGNLAFYFLIQNEYLSFALFRSARPSLKEKRLRALFIALGLAILLSILVFFLILQADPLLKD